MQDRGRTKLFIKDETKDSAQEYDPKKDLGVPLDNVRIKVDKDVSVQWILTGSKEYSSAEKIYTDLPAKFWGEEIEKFKITPTESTHIEIHGSG